MSGRSGGRRGRLHGVDLPSPAFGGLLDLEQWYDDAESYAERVQYMYRSNPPPATGDADQFRDGGGPALLPNQFRTRDDARRTGRRSTSGLTAPTSMPSTYRTA